RTNLKRVHRLPPSGARCGPRSDDAGGSEAHRGGLEIAETGETPRCRREARASAGEAMRPGFEVQGLREGDPSRGRGGEVCRGRFGRRHPLSRNFSSLKLVQAGRRGTGASARNPHMTVYGNIAFPLENARVSEREINERVNRTARLLQIEPLLGRKPVQLSGGQRQRVALGRAIVREPTVFLMDEPLSNLDAQLRVVMRAEIKKLQKDLGVTTIYVTHDQVEAMTMADRVALLNKGLLQQFDPPRIMYDRPANRFCASFIGSPPINLISCDVRDGGTLDAGDFRIPVPEHLSECVQRTSAQEVILGV